MLDSGETLAIFRSRRSSSRSQMLYDFAIIGAGVTGTAIARELSKYKVSAIVIEKLSDVACETSKANSGIIHAGYDAPDGSWKARMNVKSNPLYDEICKELYIPF